MKNLPGTERRERFVKMNKTLFFSDKRPPDRQTQFRVLARTTIGFRSRSLFLSNSLSRSLLFLFPREKIRETFCLCILVFNTCVCLLWVEREISGGADNFPIYNFYHQWKKGWTTAFIVPLLQTFTNHL